MDRGVGVSVLVLRESINAKRFWSKVDRSGDCWLWLRATSSKGYGRFWVGGAWQADVLAHRVAYELEVGPVPDGLTIDHLCRNTSCVNPDHLEPVTNRENILRGTGPAALRARQTHCKRGHPFDEVNTRFTGLGAQRSCRACHADRERRRRARRSASTS